ncbi:MULTISPECIES: primase-associated protein [unclassified Haloferax]|uniref:primase-associated protein n=1 Tax=unclassified Haloferax TaxID=2625095 RepID=UPI0028760418|nr:MULTISPECIES: primase-associated protein [unclassified Haloferax]MDS0243613.1 primase-associated protein [Haloferax sp. S2CR25]MDS0446734.1 primase-associated protein [Haloferax sp. S2CR25-2]
MTQSTPVEDERAAYRVATLPPEYGTTRINQLFTRGYNRYIVDGEEQPGDLLTDLERFGTAAFKEDVRADAAEEPFVDKPGILAVLATLSAICVKAHPKFEHAPPRTVQVLYDIRELYVNNLASLLREFGDGSLQQDIAEVLYAKDPGEDGPHPGRVCTGIKEMPEFGEGLYLEIPMAAASRKCLVHADTESGEAGELLTRVENNCLYVPVGDFDTKYREYARRAFKKLLRVQEENLSEDQLTWLTTNESAITERIDRFIETGHHERIWRDWNPGERTIRVLRDAIRDAPDEVVSLGEFHSAKELFEAVEAYDPEASWKRDVCNRISSPRSLGNLLASQRDHRSLTIREHGNTNHYRIQESSRGVQPLDVEAIEDLFELPCMANMAERLHEKKPVRKDLYNFARMVMWLPQYQDSGLETIVTDLKDVFSRWPWYDEQVTDYQIRYEFSNTIGGDTPLPMNCDNDDMQRYCIGQEQCPYSIWGSLPFPDEMYDQLSGTEGNGNEF